MTGLTDEALPQEARSRALAAAQAVLHQPAAADAAEAWQVVGALDRVGAHLREAYEAAAAEPWLTPAVALLTRLEEAAAWWTGQVGSPRPTWDATASSELGILLCELDALAADLITAVTESMDADPSVSVSAADAGAPAAGYASASGSAVASDYGSGSGSGSNSGPAAAYVPAPASNSAYVPESEFARESEFAPEPESALARLRRRAHGRLLPSIGLAAAAVVGVIGGITFAANHAASGGVQRRAIASEPVPFTLHNGSSADAGATAPASLPATSDPASAIGVPGNLAGAQSAAPHAAPGAPSPGATATAVLAAAHGPHRLPPSPRHAAPRQLAPFPAVNPYQAQLALLAAAVRAANEQETDPQLRDFSQHVVQNEFPLVP